MRFTRFFSPLKSSGSDSSRLFCDPLLCRNWWLLYDFRRVIFPDPVTLNRFEAVLFVFSFDFFGMLFLRSRLRPRHEHHDHQAAVQSWSPLDRRDVGQKFGHMIELFSPEIRVRDLAGPELAGHLDLVAVL